MRQLHAPGPGRTCEAIGANPCATQRLYRVVTPRHAHPPLLMLACVLLCACGDTPPVPEPAHLTWFTLDGDRHNLREARAAQTELLRLDPWPRWFIGPAELVSIAEIERRRKAEGVVVEEARIVESGTPPGMRWLATVPVRPRRLTDVPLTQTGARLELTFDHTDAPGELRLTLTLHAGERALWRECEHRTTNVLPFLFTIAVGGNPVRVPVTCAGHFGGSTRFVRLVEPGASRRWAVRVDAASVREHGTGAMTISAVFSERQHTGWAALEGELPGPDPSLELPFEGAPVMIRSLAAAVPVSP